GAEGRRRADLGRDWSAVQGRGLLHHRRQARGRAAETAGGGGEARRAEACGIEAYRRRKEEKRLRRQVKAHERLAEALARAARKIGAPALPEFRLETPRDPAHGDAATNLALLLAKTLEQKPRQVAERLVAALELPAGLVRQIEIAGPGFINFFLAKAELHAVLPAVLTAGDKYGTSDGGRGTRVNVEFVSANPTGPLHVGHGRGAALGDAIAELLEWTGHAVTREFSGNDAGPQIDKLARSLWARVQQAVGRPAAIPEGGYHGEYLVELAATILAREGRRFADLPEDEGVRRCREIGVESQRAEQDADLREFGVKFDVISCESSLYRDGLLQQTLNDLATRGYTYEQDGALWLRTTAFGDDKDRVLRKSDGTYTYLLPDIAYHRQKHERGFARAIDVLGADHHGYVGRM